MISSIDQRGADWQSLSGLERL